MGNLLTNDVLRSVSRDLELDKDSYLATKDQVLEKSEIDLGGGDSAVRVQGAVSVGGTMTKIQVPAQDLSVAPLSYTTILTSTFFIRNITIHFSDGAGVDVPVDETVKIFIDYGNSIYDTKIIDEQTTDENDQPQADFTYAFDGDFSIYGGAGTQIRVEISNSGLTGIAGLTINTEVLP